MAVRLQMKLGVVAEADRLPDSPDTVLVVEPSVGSVARSKGHLYLLVTSAIPGPRGREATRLTAETIRNEFYYDESPSIRGAIERAIGLANKRLAHQRERLGLGEVTGPHGPIGVGLAVVRGTEVHVATFGPADAYLIRHARLAALPDADRGRGLPTTAFQPTLWRGEIAIGDSLVLVSPNVVGRLGLEELKDALVTLHPQSAVEHLHNRFAVAGGSGSDGAIAFEAAEATTAQRPRPLVPAAAAPSGSAAIPVTDGAGGVAAMQAGARQARTVAGTAFRRAVVRLQDLLPGRRPGHRRVTTATTRRDTQRRAAVALLAFLVVAFGLGVAVFMAPPDPGRPRVVIASGSGAPAGVDYPALDLARTNLAQVSAPGIDLVATSPEEARTLLTEAYTSLDEAREAGVPPGAVEPVREQVVAQLDRLYRMVTIGDQVILDLTNADQPTPDIAAVAQGPDGWAYILDRGSGRVGRVDGRAGRATLVIREGTNVRGTEAAPPRLLGSGGPHLLVLDADNVLFRWQPGADGADPTTEIVPLQGSGEWGEDVIALGTFVTDAEQGLYNLYVLNQAEGQVFSYAPDAEGDGFPSSPSAWLNETRELDEVTGFHVDGDVWLVDGGEVVRFASGELDGWAPAAPGDELLREPPVYRLIASASPRREGRVYLHDSANGRILAFDKADGAFIEQYQMQAGNEDWADMRAMYVIPGTRRRPAVLIWVSASRVHSSPLAPLPAEEPAASGSPEASAPTGSGPAASIPASPEGSAAAP